MRCHRTLGRKKLNTVIRITIPIIRHTGITLSKLSENVVEVADNILPLKILKVWYESLDAAPEKEAKRVLDFLEVRDARFCQAFEHEPSTFKPSLIGQWKEELSEQLAVIFQWDERASSAVELCVKFQLAIVIE